MITEEKRTTTTTPSNPISTAGCGTRPAGNRDTAAALRDDRGARRDQAADTRDQQARNRADSHHPHSGSNPADDSDTELIRLVRAAGSDRAYAHVDRVAAGDRALIAVAAALTTAQRPYDLVIRYGGDEFLCAAQGVDVHAARLRFARVNQVLARTARGVSVTAGVALLRAGDTTDEVIARADADLYQSPMNGQQRWNARLRCQHRAGSRRRNGTCGRYNVS